MRTKQELWECIKQKDDEARLLSHEISVLEGEYIAAFSPLQVGDSVMVHKEGKTPIKAEVCAVNLSDSSTFGRYSIGEFNYALHKKHGYRMNVVSVYDEDTVEKVDG